MSAHLAGKASGQFSAELRPEAELHPEAELRPEAEWVAEYAGTRLTSQHPLLQNDALSVAPLLLDSVLRVTTGARARREPRETVAIRITEVEAYLGPADSSSPDPGSHAYRGRRPGNRVMFGPPGQLYVYFTYGMHYCANLVCSPEGTSSGVLFRAGEVIEGLETARLRRPAARRDAELASGPARLAAALGLGRAANGTPLAGTLPGTGEAVAAEPHVSVTLADSRPSAIVQGPRVGVAGPGGGPEYPWRFWIDGDPTVSRYRPAKVRPATQ